jgi:hypothetical protein
MKIWMTGFFAIVLAVSGAEWAAAGCVVESTGTYSEGANLRDDKCEPGGGKKMTLSTKLAGEDTTNQVFRLESQWEYETVAASQTAQVLGGVGAAGDLLHALVCVVSTAATAATSILDNATSIAVFPNSPGGGIGTYTIPLDIVSTGGAWKVTTGAGVACIAIGRFS